MNEIRNKFSRVVSTFSFVFISIFRRRIAIFIIAYFVNCFYFFVVVVVVFIVESYAKKQITSEESLLVLVFLSLLLERILRGGKKCRPVYKYVFQ